MDAIYKEKKALQELSYGGLRTTYRDRLSGKKNLP